MILNSIIKMHKDFKIDIDNNESIDIKFPHNDDIEIGIIQDNPHIFKIGNEYKALYGYDYKNNKSRISAYIKKSGKTILNFDIDGIIYNDKFKFIYINHEKSVELFLKNININRINAIINDNNAYFDPYTQKIHSNNGLLKSIISKIKGILIKDQEVYAVVKINKHTSEKTESKIGLMNLYHSLILNNNDCELKKDNVIIDNIVLHEHDLLIKNNINSVINNEEYSDLKKYYDDLFL